MEHFLSVTFFIPLVAGLDEKKPAILSEAGKTSKGIG